MSTAAGIIIGDEILTGKVVDTNSAGIIATVNHVGAQLVRLSVIGDDPQQIADEVNLCRGRCDVVITSGGVGPTHDDRTMEGVARALGRQVVRHPDIERRVRAYWKERLNEAALKLAEVPEGARLIHADDGFLPLVAVDNIYILPGVPQLFSAKLQLMQQELNGRARELHSIYLKTDESTIAALLAQVEHEYAGVKIGSYPRMGDPDYRVRVTVESTEGDGAAAALDRLLDLLSPAMVVRVVRDEQRATSATKDAGDCDEQ